MAVVLLLAALCAPGRATAQASAGDANGSTSSGPIRLRQPQAPSTTQTERASARPASPLEAVDGEFERFVQRIANSNEIRRLGADLALRAGREPELQDYSPVVPADYVVSAGDEVVLTLWGSIDADLRLVVDRNGRIQIPRVGSVLVAGVKYEVLAATIERQVRRVFKNFELSASLGQLRGIRVFVTGFAERPGTYSVSSLASVASVVFKAGGPAPSGSFRQIELRRRGKLVAQVDLYDLIVRGQREADALVQAADVIHIGPVGRQVALIGSVNKPAVFEMKSGETIGDLLQMAGGFNSVADRSRLAVERLDERTDLRIRQVAWPAEQTLTLEPGDVVRAFSAVATVQPVERQNKRVRIEGEVLHPGEFILPPGSSVSDLVRIAGGLTGSAFLYGAEFRRESVRRTQQVNYERALRDVEVELSRHAATGAARTAEEAQAQALQQASNERLVQRLRDIKPDGRVVMQVPMDTKELPDLALEDGDLLSVPTQPATVGVFGSVFNAGSYLYRERRTVDDYLRLAGSPTRGADTRSIFVVRANGSVTSAQQDSSWFGNGSGALGAQPVYPGDTLFVPEEASKLTFLQGAKDWTQVLYQFGVGLAAILSASRY